ncbi:MAG: ABC transporter permease [Terriglobales bacterium]
MTRMMNRMIVADLRRRPTRSLVSIAAVAIEVILILMVVGLVQGMINDQRNRIQGVGADILVRSGASSVLAQLSGNTLPLKMGEVFARVPGVQAVAPVAAMLGPSEMVIGGINPGQFDAVSGGFRFVQGHGFAPGSTEMIADDLQAASQHYHLGEVIRMLGRNFTLVGIFEHGMGSRVYVPLDTLDALAGTPGRASVFYVKIAHGTDVHTVVQRLRALAPAEKIDSMRQYLSLFTASTISPAINVFQRVMISIAVIIGFLVIFLSLYTTVQERTREVGILKALGASRGYIVKGILRESELLAVLGVIAGVAIAYGLWRSFTHIFPTLSMEMTWQWVVLAAVIALVSSGVGALYPAFKAAGQDAIVALAYE